MVLSSNDSPWPDIKSCSCSKVESLGMVLSKGQGHSSWGEGSLEEKR